MFSLNSVTKIFAIKRVRTCHLFCKSPVCYHSASKTHVRNRFFKLSPIHASVIYQISLNSLKVLLHWRKTLETTGSNWLPTLCTILPIFTCSTVPHLTKLISFIKCASNLSCLSHISRWIISGGQLRVPTFSDRQNSMIFPWFFQVF